MSGLLNILAFTAMFERNISKDWNQCLSENCVRKISYLRMDSLSLFVCMCQLFLHIFTYYISFRAWHSFPVYHVFPTGLRVSCVSYNRLGFAAETNDSQSSAASRWKGLFPLPLPVHCRLAVALLQVIFTPGPGRWKELCGTVPASWQRDRKDIVNNVLAAKSAGKWHVSIPSAYGVAKTSNRVITEFDRMGM